MVMEGESLLNDASSFTLFTVFISYLQVSAGWLPVCCSLAGWLVCWGAAGWR
jgi:NhaP-type Na+/H+ or K+/H+ antiporter